MAVATSVIVSIILYSLCSGSLVLVNKLTLFFLPFPSLVVTFQLIFTILLIRLGVCCRKLQVDAVQWSYVKPYLLYTVAFSLGVYCNMRSLAVSNVETVIVFRALAPLVVSVLDALFLGREWPSTRSWSALSTIALGAYGYAVTDAKFLKQGLTAYFWPSCYLLAISLEMAYGKKIISGVDLKTRSGPVLYTNMLAWIPMLCFARFGGEFEKFHMRWVDAFAQEQFFVVFPPQSLYLLALGCIVGTGIGYCSWWCRGQVSATTFTLVGVMNKCLTVLVNSLVWDQHAVPKGIAALMICLVGGAFYKQAPMRKKIEDGLDDKLLSENDVEQQNGSGGGSPDKGVDKQLAVQTTGSSGGGGSDADVSPAKKRLSPRRKSPRSGMENNRIMENPTLSPGGIVRKSHGGVVDNASIADSEK